MEVKVAKIGMENEVSLQRSLFFPILGKSLKFHNQESKLIFEYGLEPVNFHNERNLVRRFLASGVFSFFTPTNKEWDFGNREGEWTYRGESNHLHFSFQNLNSDDIYDSLPQFVKTVNALLPLLMRDRLFRDTVYDRAMPLTDSEFYDYYEEEYDEYDEPYFWDCKDLAYCINTGAGDKATFEIRINEQPFPILFILLSVALWNRNISMPKFERIVRYNEEGCFPSFLEDDEEYFSFLQKAIEVADNFYNRNGDSFSAGGKVYRDILRIAKGLLENKDDYGIEAISDLYKLNNQLFVEVFKYFEKRDRIWRARATEYKQFKALLLEECDFLRDFWVDVEECDIGRRVFINLTQEEMSALDYSIWKIIEGLQELKTTGLLEKRTEF